MAEGADLARSLGPTLREQCGGRMGELEWFVAAWSRSGAATAKTTWVLPDGRAVPAVLKVPVKPREHRWTRLLGDTDHEAWDHSCHHPTPRVLAAGDGIGHYDLAWFVLERFEGSTLSAHPTARGIGDLLQTVAAFQRQALACARPDGPLLELPHEAQLEQGRQMVRDGLIPIPEPQRWNDALKKAAKCMPRAQAEWHARPINSWCHGDVHLGNAMRRDHRDDDPDHGPCVLIDLGLVHAGHWCEDALYLERQFWGHADRLNGLRPLAALARARRDLGLDNGPDHGRFADARRFLSAASVPALFATEGHPAYATHALGLLERLTKTFAR